MQMADDARVAGILLEGGAEAGILQQLPEQLSPPPEE